MILFKELLYDFDGAFWALRLTCMACKTFIHVYWRGFSFYQFENSDGAYIYAGSAASAFINVYFYLNQIDHL